MGAAIDISGLWVMIGYSWQHTALSRSSYSLDWRRNWISGSRSLSLSWNRLILTTIIFHVFLKFLFCELNLILDIVMSFVDVSYLLESFNFFAIFFNDRIPSIPVDYMKTRWGTKVNRVDRLFVKDLSLYVFTHVLYYGSLSIHGCRLLCLGLWSQLIESTSSIQDVVTCWVFSRFLLHLVQLNARNLV